MKNFYLDFLVSLSGDFTDAEVTAWLSSPVAFLKDGSDFTSMYCAYDGL